MNRVLSCVALLTLLGCGGGADVDLPNTIPASGSVTYNGEPLADAVVMFIPNSSSQQPASGKTDASGNFTLKTNVTAAAEAEGAMAGDYTVTVSKIISPKFTPIEPPPEGMSDEEIQKFMTEQQMRARKEADEAKPPYSAIPESYGKKGESGLSASVSADNTSFTFELTDG